MAGTSPRSLLSGFQAPCASTANPAPLLGLILPHLHLLLPHFTPSHPPFHTFPSPSPCAALQAIICSVRHTVWIQHWQDGAGLPAGAPYSLRVVKCFAVLLQHPGPAQQLLCRHRPSLGLCQTSHFHCLSKPWSKFLGQDRQCMVINQINGSL